MYLTPSRKAAIDRMSYEQLLHEWRHGPEHPHDVSVYMYARLKVLEPTSPQERREISARVGWL